jgi:hypothetical protein
LAPIAAQASIIETDTSGVLDPYTGETYLIPPPFGGNAASLTSLDFRADISFSEQVQVVGGDGSFTLHYDATMFGQTVAAFSTPVSVSGGIYATTLSFGFAGAPVLPDPELSIAVWLTPDVGYFPSDAAHSISGEVYLQTFYDPPSLVPEPASHWLLAGLMLTAWPMWHRRVRHV